MKLAAVSVLAALVAAPLAAQAAQAPARWSASLSGQVVSTYSYAQSAIDEECIVSRMGWERRELLIRSLRPTRIEVARIRNRADYRPAVISRVSTTLTVGGRRWTERRRCRGGPVETTSGTCQPIAQRPRTIRAGFRWAGVNRIWFRQPAVPAAPFNICGLNQPVRSNGWLNVAIGRVNEDALLAGRSLRVIARGEARRQGTIVNEQDLSVGEELNVRWTLTFRRVR
jgi:hypothetical protein